LNLSKNLCNFALCFKKYLFSLQKYTILTMGRGDKRSKRGKITLGSYGNNRPKPAAVRKAKAATAAAAPAAE
jgi:30S ribosomal protein S31